jgi:branched-chain amino acid transport system substrate-binding protein
MGASACIRQSRAEAGQAVRIGLSLGLTGKYRELAAMNKRGYEQWRDDINANGGLLGRKVELIIVDDQSDSERARAIYRDLTLSDPVDHVFGPYSSELVEAIAPITEAAGFPLLAAGASGDKLWQKGYRSLFAMLTPASRYTEGMITLAHDAGFTTLAILAADNPFSAGVVEGTTRWAPYLGLKTVAHVDLPQAKLSLAAELRQAQDAHAELVVVAGYLKEAVAARRAAAEIGWMPRAFYATIGPASADWRSELGSMGDGAFSTSTWEPVDLLDYPGAKKFAEDFRKRYGSEPSYQAATAYAAGQILEAAARAANDLDRGSIRLALFELDTYSVVGRFAVDHTGMQVKREEMIIQWQNGRKEIVWPAEIRTAMPIFAPP